LLQLNYILIVVDHPDIESVKRHRIEKPPKQDRESPESEEAPMYQHLQAVTRNVSRQTIETKWEPLPSGCVERISQLLQDLQRPVIVRYNDERKKMQSSTALQMISRRLVSKISKGLPFPQGTRNHREDDFDFEKILDHNRALEAQLTPALHANELLEAQVNKELALLESEQERLAMLEANAKIEAALRSEAVRRLHSLLQPQEGVMEIEGLNDDMGLSVAQVPRPVDLNVSILTFSGHLSS
jgi:CENP-Q, a CENPA-CAD centromere complex subunit